MEFLVAALGFSVNVCDCTWNSGGKDCQLWFDLVDAIGLLVDICFDVRNVLLVLVHAGRGGEGRWTWSSNAKSFEISLGLLTKMIPTYTKPFGNGTKCVWIVPTRSVRRFLTEIASALRLSITRRTFLEWHEASTAKAGPVAVLLCVAIFSAADTVKKQCWKCMI